MKHFKNPVSMRVTQEQFERDLRKPLEELGAKFVDIREFSRYHLLVSNAGNKKGFVGNVHETAQKTYNRYFIENYDPEQFISICKLGVEMIVGECYTVVHNDGSFMIGYLLENNTENKKNELRGFFKGLDFKNLFLEKDCWLYNSFKRTIRLSTPEEKAKLDKVIAGHEKPTWIEQAIENIKNLEVKDELIITDSEPKPKPIKVIDKVKSDLKKAKKQVKLLTEVLKYLENGNN